MTTALKQNIYQLIKLNKHFRLKDTSVAALDNVSFNVQEGSIVGIIGRSGAGKSTLLRCLNLLEKPDSGQILYKDLDLQTLSKDNLRKTRQEIGMIFQHFNLLSRRTALENVALGIEFSGKNKAIANSKAIKCLELVGLAGRESAYPSELSGGQKQRVAIARALALDAKVLLCDEATSALDPETTEDILKLLKNLRLRLGLTVVLITHEISVVRDICDQIYVMDQGQVVEQGSVEDIFSSPKHPITSTFIESLVSSRIPDVIAKNLLQDIGELDSDVALHLMFTGETAQKPIIADLIRKYGADINILSGYIDHIGNTNFGTLVITLPNHPETLSSAESFLKSQNVIIRKLGYLPKVSC